MNRFTLSLQLLFCCLLMTGVASAQDDVQKDDLPSIKFLVDFTERRTLPGRRKKLPPTWSAMAKKRFLSLFD